MGTEESIEQKPETGVSCWESKDEYEVIGNIYEHPHLLKAEARVD
jgi:hypothetical protein